MVDDQLAKNIREVDARAANDASLAWRIGHVLALCMDYGPRLGRRNRLLLIGLMYDYYVLGSVSRESAEDARRQPTLDDLIDAVEETLKHDTSSDAVPDTR